MKPTLVILAAGMGSRYGGLKQIDKVGSGGEAIIDFTMYDALLCYLSVDNDNMRVRVRKYNNRRNR